MSIIIGYVGGHNNLAMLAFHVAKPKNSEPQHVEEAEYQAFDTCTSHLDEHADLQCVHAFTSFGTKVEHGIVLERTISYRPYVRPETYLLNLSSTLKYTPQRPNWSDKPLK